MKTAAERKQSSAGIANKVFLMEMEDVEKAMDNAERRGVDFVSVERLSPRVQAELTRLGYTVKDHDALDQRDSDTTMITW